MRFAPGGCCDNCDVLRDDFDRDDDTDIGDKWTEDAGDWEINSGTLRAGGAGATVLSVATDDSFYVTLKYYHPTAQNGKAGRIIVDYADADNYHYLEITTNVIAGLAILQQARLWERSGGAETALTDAVTIGGATPTQYSVTICFPATTYFTAIINGVYRLVAEVTPHAGNKAGIQVVDATTTDIQIDDYRWQRYRDEGDNCPQCDATCAECEASNSEIVVDMGLGGWTDDQSTKCDEVAGEAIHVNTSDCVWTYTWWDDQVNDLARCNIALCEDGAINIRVYTLTGTLSLIGSGATLRWRYILQLSGGTTVDPDEDCSCLSLSAVYYSNFIEDCTSFPVTLFKDSESVGQWCGGSLPVFIEINV